MNDLSLIEVTNSVAFYVWFLWYWKKTQKQPYNLHNTPNDASVLLPFVALLIIQSYRYFDKHIDFGSFDYYPWRNICFQLVQSIVVLGFCYFSKNKLTTLGLVKDDRANYLDVLILAIPLLILNAFDIRDNFNVLIILRWILVSVGESLLFQAFMQPRLQKKFGPITGLWMASIVFGFYHIILKDGVILFSIDQDSIVQMIQAGLIRGPMLGYLYSKQKSIFPLIILHAAWDISVGI